MFCSKLSFLLIGILCFLQIQNGLTLNCYECEGEKDCEGSANDCGPPTKDREPFCLKVDGEYVNSGKKIVKKSCTFAPAHHSTKCEDDTSEGLTGIFCWCNTNYCNNAETKTINKFVIFSLFFVALIKFI